jgi:hypothetical protein
MGRRFFAKVLKRKVRALGAEEKEATRMRGVKASQTDPWVTREV